MGIVAKDLGVVAYKNCYEAMRQFTVDRNQESSDEIWFAEHPPVYTQGLNGKAEHLLDSGSIEIIQTDRGGQVTYHGPGQLLIYCLFDLKRKEIGVKRFVSTLEQTVIQLLNDYNIDAHREKGAPGVYVANKKIAALGIRVKHGYSYHGLALNIDMDLSPYEGINPCGFAGLAITQLSHYEIYDDRDQVIKKLLPILSANFGGVVDDSGCFKAA